MADNEREKFIIYFAEDKIRQIRKILKGGGNALEILKKIKEIVNE